MRVALIVGHSAASPGACSTYLGICEYRFNKPIARQVAQKLPCDFETRVFLRDGIGLTGVAQEVNAWGADLALSLHFNANANLTANGTEVLHYPGSEEGERFAESLQDELLEAFPLADRGTKPRGDLAILRLTTMPCALAEPFFGSSPRDTRYVADKTGRLARAYADAIETYAKQL